MQINTQYALKNLTTFGVEARAKEYIGFINEDEIVDFLSSHPLGNKKYLILGGGSNLLFLNDFDGLVIHPRLTGIEVLAESTEAVRVRVMAGEVWDDFVEYSVKKGWGGIENLSLIPGCVGASAVQNIGAYGMEVKDVIECVDAIHTGSLKKQTFFFSQCGFGYRESRFKKEWRDQYIITAVTYRLLRKPAFITHYPGVQREVDALGEVNLSNVRQAIINIRRRKLPEPFELGNAGSFFKNPVVEQSVSNDLGHSYPDLPNYPQHDGRVKLPAGWLIDRCGWKGKTIGKAAVYHKQALVIVNLGGATGREIFDLSERIKTSVIDKFGIELEREVRVVE